MLFVVSIATMLMLDMTPGHPAYTMLGDQATPDQVAEVTKQLGLDRPIWVRYGDWLSDVVRGDFGRSFTTRQPVFDAITERVPVTLQLAVMALAMALVISVPLGVYTAFRANRALDRGWRTFTSFTIAVPHFVAGLALVYLLAVRYQVFPVTGWNRITEGIGANLRSAFLPALTLALGEIAVFSRLLRADMLTTLQNDYVLAARARGLSAGYVLLRHALRPSSFSLLTLAGISLGRLIGGAIVVESLFALPGLGQLVVQAVTSADLVMVQGVIMFVAVVYVLVNGFIDVTYSFLDPRLRQRSAT